MYVCMNVCTYVCMYVQALAKSDPVLGEAMSLHQWLSSWENQRRSMSILQLAAASEVGR